MMVVPIRCSPVVGASKEEEPMNEEASMAAGGQIEIGGTLATCLQAQERKKEKENRGGERRTEMRSAEYILVVGLDPYHLPFVRSFASNGHKQAVDDAAVIFAKRSS